MRLAFKSGFVVGGVKAGLMTVTGGAFPGGKISIEEDAADAKRLGAAEEKVVPDGKLTFSKEHLVGFSGTQHEVDPPPHLVVADTDLCSDVCTEEYGNPCENFCPAAVYEMVPDPDDPGRKQLFIHHENCVHCKTCDIADPYQVITWTPPEGGEGPDYTQM